MSSRRGLAALHEKPPVGRRVVRYCSVCGAVWTTIFTRLTAKKDFTVIEPWFYEAFRHHDARPAWNAFSSFAGTLRAL